MNERIYTIFILILFFTSCLKTPVEPESTIIVDFSESQDGKSVAFSYLFTNSYDRISGIYVSDYENNEKQLIYPISSRETVNWSPDNKKIATEKGIITLENGKYKDFLSNKDLGIYTYNLNWSPDGKLLLFGNEDNIYICDTLFQNYRIIPLKGYDAKWMPSGNKLLYSKDDGIYISDTLSYTEVQLINSKDVSNPICSPNGMSIAWIERGKIWVANVDGTNQRLLDNTNSSISWSSDSQNILYSRIGPDGWHEFIWKIDKNGNNKKQITF